MATPAAGITPPRGFLVSFAQSTDPLTAAAMLSVSVTSTGKNLAEGESCWARALPSSSFLSRRATLPPSLTISSAVALPRPDALRTC